VAKDYGHMQIVYRASDSFNSKAGTLIAWGFLNPALDGVDFLVANGASIIAAPGQYANFYYHFGNGTDNIFDYGGISASVGADAIPSRQWTHFAITWDAEAGLFNTYQDGVLVNAGTTAPTYILTQRKITIGGDYLYKEMDYWQGAIDTIDIYGDVKDVTFVLADFNSTKASYGR